MTNVSPAKGRAPDGVASLIADVRALIASARNAAASTVNTLQVMTNFEIGRRIVEHEQKGETRAEYGAELLKELSARLTEEFGIGFSERNLRSFRSFFLTYRERIPQIWQQPTAKLGAGRIARRPVETSLLAPISQQPALKCPFTLSWTHYVLLLTIKDPDERSFYEIEATNQGWSVPELKRQKATALYERLALSRDKDGIRELASKGQVVAKPEDILREPYVLEFLGLQERPGYSESDLETAIIDHLEHFLLELGKGFLFEARQKRFTFDEDHLSPRPRVPALSPLQGPVEEEAHGMESERCGCRGREADTVTRAQAERRRKMNRTCPTPLRATAGVDVNPGALRTSSRNVPDAEAMAGSVRSRQIMKRCQADGGMR